VGSGAALLGQAERNDNVRMVVFSGEGDKAFVSGADISQFEDLRAQKEAVKRYEQLAEAALQGIYEFGKPTIACIRGYCIGGGVNVAISCDLRVASSDSVFRSPLRVSDLGTRFSAMKNLVQLDGSGSAKDIFSPVAGSMPPRRCGSGSSTASRSPRTSRAAGRVHDRDHHWRAAHHQGRQADHPEVSKLPADFDADACASGSSWIASRATTTPRDARRSWKNANPCSGQMIER
jgi:hypothetical protein